MPTSKIIRIKLRGINPVIVAFKWAYANKVFAYSVFRRDKLNEWNR